MSLSAPIEGVDATESDDVEKQTFETTSRRFEPTVANQKLIDLNEVEFERAIRREAISRFAKRRRYRYSVFSSAQILVETLDCYKQIYS